MKLHLFGFDPNQAPEPEEAPSRVRSFLRGEPVTLDAELAAALLREFSAQEAFRLRMVERVKSTVQRMTHAAAELAPMLEVPYVQVEAYGVGYRAGAYKAQTECAQLVQDVINGMMAEMG